MLEYLEGCFRDNGCRPLEKQNHISAKVSLDVLGEAIQASGTKVRVRSRITIDGGKSVLAV
jgi:hypothetical protein